MTPSTKNIDSGDGNRRKTSVACIINEHDRHQYSSTTIFGGKRFRLFLLIMMTWLGAVAVDCRNVDIVQRTDYNDYGGGLLSEANERRPSDNFNLNEAARLDSDVDAADETVALVPSPADDPTAKLGGYFPSASLAVGEQKEQVGGNNGGIYADQQATLLFGSGDTPAAGSDTPEAPMDNKSHEDKLSEMSAEEANKASAAATAAAARPKSNVWTGWHTCFRYEQKSESSAAKGSDHHQLYEPLSSVEAKRLAESVKYQEECKSAKFPCCFRITFVNKNSPSTYGCMDDMSCGVLFSETNGCVLDTLNETSTCYCRNEQSDEKSGIPCNAGRWSKASADSEGGQQPSSLKQQDGQQRKDKPEHSGVRSVLCHGPVRLWSSVLIKAFIVPLLAFFTGTSLLFN